MDREARIIEPGGVRSRQEDLDDMSGRSEPEAARRLGCIVAWWTEWSGRDGISRRG